MNRSFKTDFRSAANSFIAKIHMDIAPSNHPFATGETRIVIYDEAKLAKIKIGTDNRPIITNFEVADMDLETRKKAESVLWYNLNISEFDSIAVGLTASAKGPIELMDYYSSLKWPVEVTSTQDTYELKWMPVNDNAIVEITYIYSNNSNMRFLECRGKYKKGISIERVEYDERNRPKSRERRGLLDGVSVPENLTKTIVLKYDDATFRPETFAMKQFDLPEFHNDGEMPPVMGTRQYIAIAICLGILAIFALIARHFSRARQAA